jgi:hypothetical protein
MKRQDLISMSIIFKTTFFILVVWSIVIYTTAEKNNTEIKYTPPGVITVEELPPIGTDKE